MKKIIIAGILIILMILISNKVNSQVVQKYNVYDKYIISESDTIIYDTICKTNIYYEDSIISIIRGTDSLICNCDDIIFDNKTGAIILTCMNDNKNIYVFHYFRSSFWYDDYIDKKYYKIILLKK